MMRQMTNDDLRTLYHFAAPIWRECYHKMLPAGQIDRLTHMYFDYPNVLRFQQEGMQYYYVVHHKKIAGFVVYMETPEFVYLDKLYLLKEYRGMHLSSLIIHHLEKYFLPIRLNVNKKNVPAIKAYEANGFKQIGTEITELSGGYRNDDYILERLPPFCSLPNIGGEVAQQLLNAGVQDYLQLKALGAEQAWLKIQQVDKTVCVNRLMALEGAIHGIKKGRISDERKAELKAFYAEHKINP